MSLLDRFSSVNPWWIKPRCNRSAVDHLPGGMVLKPAVKYQRIAKRSVPRDNH
jgi:dihydroxy-acid dehydratase